jgi:hypothetical protein
VFQERDMAEKNLYSMSGEYSFYQRGKYFYSAHTHECEFYQQGDHFYSMKSGEPLFYQRDKYLYSMSGTTSYYFA